jgi:hypothetical protein
MAGAVLSIAGLGLVLWSIIEAPVRGWSSALVIGAGLAGLAVLAGFGLWERASSHPMLNLQFFRRPSFSAAVGANGLAMFALAGALFVLTQFLQFNLGYWALQAGVRMLVIAAAIAVTAPVSSVVVRLAGTSSPPRRACCWSRPGCGRSPVRRSPGDPGVPPRPGSVPAGSRVHHGHTGRVPADLGRVVRLRRPVPAG